MPASVRSVWKYVFVIASILLLFLVLQWTTNRPAQLSTQDGAIWLDGFFEDWEQRAPVVTDPIEDGIANGIDFSTIFIENDAEYLYIKVDLGIEVNLQTDSGVMLYIDTDNDPNSGDPVQGMGADIVYDFGERMGKLYAGKGGKGIRHVDIGLVTLPTVTSSVFEIAIRGTTPPGTGLYLTPGQTIRVGFADKNDGGDSLPDLGQSIEYTIHPSEVEPPVTISLAKEDSTHLRVVTFNILKDNLLDKKKTEQYARIMQALQPDIINFQEVYIASAERVRKQVEAWLPLESGQWYAGKGMDMVTVSRFPIVETRAPGFINLSGAYPFLIQLSEEQYLLIVNAHLRCCEADEERQMQADGFNAFLRIVQSPENRDYMPENTPIILLGDLNLVGQAQQLTTLVQGDIIYNSRFGDDRPADWDGTFLTDLVSRHPEDRLSYTWSDSETTFSPGRLDFMIYTDSVLEIAKTFILNTGGMSAELLAEFELNSNDSAAASDHFPIVTDFVIK